MVIHILLPSKKQPRYSTRGERNKHDTMLNIKLFNVEPPDRKGAYLTPPPPLNAVLNPIKIKRIHMSLAPLQNRTHRKSHIPPNTC